MPQFTIMSTTDRSESCTLCNTITLNAITPITSKIKYWDSELVYCKPQNVHHIRTQHQTSLMNYFHFYTVQEIKTQSQTTNYLHQFYKPHKDIAMGSPIPGTIAEIYLHYLENDYIKHWLDSNEISFYKHYVDDIFIIYNQNKIKEDQILLKIKSIDKNLQFKMTKEENSNINFLDLAINRGRKIISISIYRKTTNIDTTIHYLSNHPFEQKISAYGYYIQRMLTLPISQIGINKEWTIICAMAKSNGFPESIINNLRKRLTLKNKHLNQ